MLRKITDLEQHQQALSALDDRGLVLAYQSGDPLAFPAIYERYRPTARRVAHGIVGNREEAEELAQEAMLRVYQSLARFDGEYQLQAWVIRIATNVALDAARARSRRPLRADATIEDITDHMAAPADQISDPQEAVERLLESDLVHEVLASLPEHHRAALVLREFEGRSHLEIADALDISPAQAKALIHRAKESFRKAWNATAQGVAGFVLPAFLLLKRMASSIAEHSTHFVENTTGLAASSIGAKVIAGTLVAGIAAGGAVTIPRATGFVANAFDPKPSATATLGAKTPGGDQGAAGQTDGESGGGAPAPAMTSFPVASTSAGTGGSVPLVGTSPADQPGDLTPLDERVDVAATRQVVVGDATWTLRVEVTATIPGDGSDPTLDALAFTLIREGDSSTTAQWGEASGWAVVATGEGAYALRPADGVWIEPTDVPAEVLEALFAGAAPALVLSIGPDGSVSLSLA